MNSYNTNIFPPLSIKVISMGTTPGTHYASVTMLDSDCPILHLRSLIPSPQTTQLTFRKRLVSYGTPDLWDNLLVDGDGSWLWLGLLTSSLCIAHNGLYMAKELTTLCLAGILIYCGTSKCWLKTLVAEQMDSATVLTLLILRAAESDLVPPLLPKVVLYCDNHGILSHGNSPLLLLPQKQKQTNLIWLIKYLCGSNTCDSTWEWVEGHVAERKGWVNCTLPEWLNELSDKLA
jgi:hypothetical protein